MKISSDTCILRKQVVLDLDETLVCAYETSTLPTVLHNQAIEAGLKWFDLECISSDKVIQHFVAPFVGSYSYSNEIC